MVSMIQIREIREGDAATLYKKMGFVVEGTSVDSLFVNGRYVDELDMAKFISP